MENPDTWMIWRYPQFQETSIFSYIFIYFHIFFIFRFIWCDLMSIPISQSGRPSRAASYRLCNAPCDPSLTRRTVCGAARAAAKNFRDVCNDLEPPQIENSRTLLSHLFKPKRLSCSTVVRCREANSLFISAGAQNCYFFVFPPSSYFERLVK